MENQELIAAYISKAREAQRKIQDYSQEQIDKVIRHIAWEVYKDDNIQRLAALAVEETSMGSVKDKITKHKNKIMGMLADALAFRSVGMIEYDEAKGIRKFAKPIGVIGALTPVTNPTATPGSNAIAILKGRNAVIFAPHPKAKMSTALAVEFMRDGLKKAGAPVDLIQVLENPSIELTGELMKQADLVVATGGAQMVKAAYSSGKPAYGVGPGNSCQIIAEDADIEDAAAKIASSKAFDNATSCSSENSIIIQQSIYEAMVSALVQNGGYLVKGEERELLRNTMWQINKKGKLALNGNIVARSAVCIAAMAGITVPDSTTMLLVEGTMPLEEDKFAEEKLSPVLTLWKYGSFAEGVEILSRLTDHCGTGHSCGIHSFNEDYITYLGEHMKSSRIMVRQPQAAANGGAFFNGMPSTVTLGCGTWGNNITTENISCKHFINVTWLSEPIPMHRPTDEEIFGTELMNC